MLKSMSLLLPALPPITSTVTTESCSIGVETSASSSMLTPKLHVHEHVEPVEQQVLLRMLK